MSEINTPNPEERALTIDELDGATGGTTGDATGEMAVYIVRDDGACPQCGSRNCRVSFEEKLLVCADCGYKFVT